MIKKLINIKGMCCSRCVRALKQELSKLELGKTSVRLGEIEVAYDPTVVTSEEIERAVEDAGFEVMVLLKDKQIEQAKCYVRDNLSDAEKLRLSVMARALAVSPSHLSRTFSVLEQETIQDFIARVRVERAAQLLRETDMNVIDIALSVGINSPSHFNKLFKRHLACTPSQYRKNPQLGNKERILSKIAKDIEGNLSYLCDMVMEHVTPAHGRHLPRKR